MGGRTSVDDPLKVYKYRVEVDGFQRAGCSEVSGFAKLETDIAEYREGGDQSTVRKSPGLTKFPDVTLKRGLLSGSTGGGDDDFRVWAKTTFQTHALAAASNFRKTVDIVVYRRDNTEAFRVRYYECFSKDLKGSGDLKGDSSDNSIEEMVFAHEGFDIIVA